VPAAGVLQWEVARADLDLDVIAAAAVETAWEIRGRQQQVAPQWFLAKNGRVSVTETKWYDDEQKRAAVLLMAGRVRRSRPDAVVFVSDTWLRRLPVSPGAGPAGDSVRVPEDDLPPGEAFDAVEAIIAEIFTRGRARLMVRAYRQRDDGTLEILDEYTADGMNVGTVSGPIMRALWGGR